MSLSAVLVGSSLLGIASWLLLLGRILGGRPWRYRVTENGAGDPGRSLSVIVPARNEAENLAECLPTLLRQDVPGLEVVVVDDRSTDRTRDVLRGFDGGRLRVVEGEPKPEGWAGKNWAAHQGYRAARGDWLLFTDADVRFGPGALREALRSARPGTLTTRLGGVEFREPLSRALEPLLGLLLTAVAPLAAVNDPDRADVALAWGGFLLFPRPLYERIGGHRALRERVDDDLALAEAVAEGGGSIDLRVTGDVDHVCSRSAGETVRRYRRYWSLAWRRHPGIAGGVAGVLALGHLLPAALALASGTGGSAMIPLAALLGLSHLVALPAYAGAGLSPLWTLGLWPALGVQVALALLTLVRPDEGWGQGARPGLLP